MVSISSVRHKQHLGALTLQFQPAGDALHHLLHQHPREMKVLKGPSSLGAVQRAVSTDRRVT